LKFHPARPGGLRSRDGHLSRPPKGEEELITARIATTEVAETEAEVIPSLG
jgi:hypothetical protein